MDFKLQVSIFSISLSRDSLNEFPSLKGKTVFKKLSLFAHSVFLLYACTVLEILCVLDVIP